LTPGNARRHIARTLEHRRAGLAPAFFRDRARPRRAASGGKPDGKLAQGARAALDEDTFVEVDVLAKPCPSELTAPINPDRGVEGHRNLFCNYYDGCLDEAVKKGWNSWSCTRCDLFALQPEVEQGLESYATQRRLG
jgi:hypothetical protein